MCVPIYVPSTLLAVSRQTTILGLASWTLRCPQCPECFHRFPSSLHWSHGRENPYFTTRERFGKRMPNLISAENNHTSFYQARYVVSFVGSESHLYFALVTALMCPISCYTRPRYSCIKPHTTSYRWLAVWRLRCSTLLLSDPTKACSWPQYIYQCVCLVRWVLVDYTFPVSANSWLISWKAL